jgi:hypothetical protein
MKGPEKPSILINQPSTRVFDSSQAQQYCVSSRSTGGGSVEGHPDAQHREVMGLACALEPRALYSRLSARLPCAPEAFISHYPRRYKPCTSPC